MLVIFLYMEVLLFSNQKVPYKAFKVSKPTSYKNAQHQNQLRCWATEAPVLFVSINVFDISLILNKGWAKYHVIIAQSNCVLPSFASSSPSRCNIFMLHFKRHKKSFLIIMRLQMEEIRMTFLKSGCQGR